MKKSRFILPLLLICAVMLSGCGSAAESRPQERSIVTTIFPMYDWACALIVGATDGVRLTLLLDDGTDMHSYQPTVDDLVRISSCDLFIYVGGESDAWVEDALKEAVNPDMIVLNLMDVLGDAAKIEETVEGMQEEDGEEEAEYDEHIWLSLRNAKTCCAAITDALIALFPEREQELRKSCADYAASLEAIDAGYRSALEDRARDTLLFADRFPFRYLLDDYGLSYYAAFPGCEAETEASFETVVFLARKVDELALPAVLTTESPVPRLAETVVENTASGDAEILALDSMQAARIEEGISYLSRMETNLENLRKALK